MQHNSRLMLSLRLILLIVTPTIFFMAVAQQGWRWWRLTVTSVYSEALVKRVPVRTFARSWIRLSHCLALQAYDQRNAGEALDQGVVKLNDPLSKYAPPGARVPTYQGAPITLVNLATHTSALPREQPGGAAKRTVFTWPTRTERWNWLSTATLKSAPGTQAAYSNLAFDLLADALANAAGKPYPQLFEEQITRPLGMKDTTFTPSPDQCRRLMVAEKGASPCDNTLAAIGSGGVYSTPGDMMRWMQQFLSSDFYSRNSQADRMQTLIYQRNQLTRVIGMDVPGKADALGLGWVYMAPKDGHPGIIQKTGGGGGFITYMAMIPQSNVGVFVVITRSPLRVS
jgi:D-alanyl-D-alanine-carboxypeptidase/D-alanyl-D-alanine-endopeptidase